MSAVMQQSRSEPPRRKSVRIRVLDAAGQLFFGSTIAFWLRDTPVGAVEDSTGEASITYPESGGTLLIGVSARGAKQSQLVKPGDSDNFDFQLPVHRTLDTPPHPVARCPDGTAGQPCVNCYIGGSTIRVCG